MTSKIYEFTYLPKRHYYIQEENKFETFVMELTFKLFIGKIKR